MTSKQIIGLISGFLLFLPYGFASDKLYRYLEKNQIDTKLLGMPKRVWGIFYLKRPSATFNAMRFLFSKESFGNIRIGQLKRQAQRTFLLFCVGLIIWTVSVLDFINKVKRIS